MTEQELVKLFEKLGARNPAGWAHSQASEGIPQLARFLFLRQAWNLVVKDSDSSWISEVGQTKANVPGGAIGPAITRLMSDNVSREDLTIVVRVMQWRLLSGLCRLLDDPGMLEREVDDIAWRLFQVDENDCPIAPISGLVESVLETDPTGREMRPR
jgi:hypothetical protein